MESRSSLDTQPPSGAAATKPPAPLFISHASQDATAAEQIREALETAGLPCWIAPRDVRAGEPFAAAIVEALGACRLVILVLTRNAVESPHVFREVERACSKRRPIVSIRLDETPLPAELEYFLSSNHWIDATTRGVDAILPAVIDAARDRPERAANAGSAAPATQTPARSGASRTRGAWFVGAGVVGLLALGLAFTYLARGHLRSTLPVQATGSPAPEKSIAVLPFADMGERKDQDYFADGMAEEVLTALARVDGLKVSGRTSSFSFKGKSADLKVIGATLGVANILEGSVRKQGSRVRITAELVRADDGFHVWSDSYDGDLNDVFDLQERIAREITTHLKVVLAGGETRLVAKATDNPEAYALFIEAQDRVNRRANLPRAIELLGRATALDPNFSRAWSKLAVANVVAPQYSDLPWETSVAQGEAAARHALALDPASAEGYAALGYIYFSAARYTEMDEAFNHALTLNPNDVTAEFWSANGLCAMGRTSAAELLIDRILAADPVNAFALLYKGILRYSKGDTAAALDLSRASMASGLANAHHLPAMIAGARGSIEAGATDFVTAWGGSSAGFTDADVRTIFHGMFGDANQRALGVAAAARHERDQRAPAMYLLLGEPARAFAAFDRTPYGLADAVLDLLWIPTDAARTARQHPSFQAFAKRHGLVAYWRKAGWPDLCRPTPERGADAFSCD